MTDVGALVTAAADVGAMGDKVAAFAIAQNLVWIAATIKDDFKLWLKVSRSYFIGGAIAAGAAYLIVEAILGWWACGLVCENGCGQEKLQVEHTTILLFVMRALGAFVSSGLAAAAFWGTTRPAPKVPL